MRWMRPIGRLLWIVAVLCCTPVAFAQADSRLHIDATDLPRRLLHAEQTFDAAALRNDRGEIHLRYPKWVPGSHAPGGPIQNLAGLWFEDGRGNPLRWRREPGDVYQFHVAAGADVAMVRARFRYITNQPNANSRGLDSYGAADIGLISPNTVLLYPGGARSDEFDVRLRLTLPAGWSAGCALEPVPSDAPGTTYDTVSLRRLVDTPIMVGRHHRVYDLNEDGVDAPPHRLHVFSESPGAIDIDERVLDNYRRMVTQAARLFGGFPFPSMDILVATTNQLGRNGLEHLRSTMNVIPLGALESPRDLAGWDRMLIPHEYVHAWCGKYRRPTGMATGDLHTPKGTELLWVYEGLTQYLGEVLEYRSGMATPDEYRWVIQDRLRDFKLREGRDWRPLVDTCSASWTLRAASANWGELRRSQDYYYEGAAVWMEADAIIRAGTHGERSLDDFVRAFFHADEPTDDPHPFGRANVVAALGHVFAHDWAGFFAERIDNAGGRGPLTLARALGYKVGYATKPPRSGFGRTDPLDARESLGASFTANGTVRSVVLGSPADNAGLAPGVRVLGVGGYVFGRQRLADALDAAIVTGTLEVMIQRDDRYESIAIEYDGGPRFLTMVRDGSRPDLLERILEPR
ncbi:MAG: hypothetical protein AAFX79_08665 [Planctomycetota bacterium]